ncbi:MAG: DUF2235 domain-containing protein [Gammaproteobacteria bacterium]|nr:DUF2235 domain-containing protein [Gammaproteobacteria bacterium]MDH5628795.1 DUF2235 domain-containing protein [Gammaproteobacteria bacterium]
MKKNIIVLSDGTGQEGGKGNNTNVYKLFNLAKDRSPDQIVFYDRGLGTGWRKISGSVSGAGISKNIIECYQFIFENYNAGDDIYLFGFSRGAATVRSLSGFIDLFGLLPKSRPELIQEAYDIYKISNKNKRKKAADSFLSKNHNMWVKIKFLGVWDTVYALGLPVKALDWFMNKIPGLKHNFHNQKLSPSVENAYHALAIDEERKVFSPSLWDKELLDHQKMQQVWFCGVHTDVGGGYKEQNLSDIPFVWMLQKAQQHGFLIYPHHKVDISQDADGVMHDSRNGIAAAYPKKVRSWNNEIHGQLFIHQSVLQRTLNKDNKKSSKYSSWVFSHTFEVEPWNKAVPL